MDIIAVIIALIVPIGVAIWSVRSSAKDTAKQIAALEESTTKHIESVKELARIQIELTSIQMGKELWESRSRYLPASEKSMDALDDHFAMLGVPYNETITRMQDRQEKRKNLSLEQDFYSKQISMLNSYMERIKAIKGELNKA